MSWSVHELDAPAVTLSKLAVLSTWWLARLFVKRIGGYTGDCLGAVQQASEAMFYLGRDRLFTEYYEQRIERARKEHVAADDPIEEIVHLMDKTNFLRCVQEAARRLGRLSLADRLSKM